MNVFSKQIIIIANKIATLDYNANSALFDYLVIKFNKSCNRYRIF